MPKARINITVDEWVKEELRRRDDINISGAANDFFIEYLSGKDKDQAAKELKIQRLKEKEKQKEKEAQEVRSQWKKLEEDLEEERQEENEVWEEALKDLRFAESEYSDTLIIESTEADISYYANELNMNKQEFADEIKERYKND